MLKASVLLPLLAAAVVSASSGPQLFQRQTTTLSCEESGGKLCGSDNACIPLTTTCCPAPGGSAGCRPGDYCAGADSAGQPICCPIGEVCTGSGGIETVGGGTRTSVSTSTITNHATSTAVDGVISTITEDSTTAETLTSTSTDDDTTTSILTSTLTVTSTSALTLTSMSSPPVLPSTHASTPPSNATTRSPTAPTPPAQFTGAADSQARGISGWLIAAVLPLVLV